MLVRTSVGEGELLGSHGVIAQLGLPALASQAQGFYGFVCTSRGMDEATPPQGNGSRGRGSGYGTKIACSYLPRSLFRCVCLSGLELLTCVSALDSNF